jgi:predicted transglutaminase-like cysteine proteinase/uncharacterized protein YkwD
MMPASCVNQKFSNQPSSIQQMELLVTPNDPVVLQTLKTILDQPQPEITEQNFYQLFEVYSHVFNRIVDWVGSHVRDVSDQSVHGVPDYWQLPAETLTLGTGDCEDYAILLCSLLRAYGVPADQVYVAVGQASSKDDHAWVVEKYYKGIWRIIDRGTDIIAHSLSDTYSTDLCFNDNNGFRGAPLEAKGVYTFELSDSFYPVYVASGTGNSANLTGPASITYYRNFKAGQKVTASLEWLPDSVYSTYNSKIIYPWSIYIYDQKGNAVFSLNDSEIKKTVEFTIKTSGIYEIEVVKRDNQPRCAKLMLNPTDWKVQKPSNLLHTPNTDIVEAPKPTVSAQTKLPTVTASIPLLSHEKLAQYMLDLINKDRTDANVQAVILGNNSSAQTHAEDMLNNLYFSQWGTDGTTSNMRYTLAGGTSFIRENEYVAKVSWQGGFDASFENVILSILAQAEISLSTSQATFLQNNSASVILYKWNKKVNIGIAYNSEYLFLVQQFEGESINFSQLPTIQKGILSFSGLNIPGFKIASSISVYYNPTPSYLTPTQLNNVPWEGSGRIVAMISETQPFNAGLFSYSSFQYTDPYTVSDDATVPPLGSLTGAVPIQVQMNISRTAASNWVVQGSTFSITADLNQVVSRFGSGVYTIYVSGASMVYTSGTRSVYTDVRSLFSYSIFVK